MQKRLSPEAQQPSSPLRSVQRDKNGKVSRYKSEDSMSTPEKSPIQSVSPQARSRTSSKNRRYFLLTSHAMLLSFICSPLAAIGSLCIFIWFLKMFSPHESPPRQRREKLTNERSLSPPKKPGTQKPSHDIPETSGGGEETYYSRFECELDNFQLLLFFFMRGMQIIDLFIVLFASFSHFFSLSLL